MGKVITFKTNEYVSWRERSYEKNQFLIFYNSVGMTLEGVEVTAASRTLVFKHTLPNYEEFHHLKKCAIRQLRFYRCTVDVSQLPTGIAKDIVFDNCEFINGESLHRFFNIEHLLVFNNSNK